MKTRRLAFVLLALLACVGTGLPASAQGVAPSQDVLSTVWVQPVPDNSFDDGLGTWVYVAREASTAHEYPMTAVFDHLRFGAVTLGPAPAATSPA